MNSVTLSLLIVCSLALAQAASWRQYEDYVESDEYVRPSWTHRHSEMWPCDVADYPAAHLLIHKVENRLDSIDNEQMRKNIVYYVVDRLRQCKTDEQMDEHCVKRSIGYAMSFINHHKRQYQQY
ncbi:uncharacterized protein LOC133838701 [Drosophila sulfurigaster albostrigata]|uniref:uncharacterized protein LOC133838701 n=1 Tax=Drosophila sulfurigaster albostrigata TaxID=89887 RepID=UPI002D21D6AD|nr:uncharacterized protein LOC133838701 [Drosophila sulfurigaster albostrigata]